jgi:hypothetical protein
LLLLLPFDVRAKVVRADAAGKVEVVMSTSTVVCNAHGASLAVVSRILEVGTAAATHARTVPFCAAVSDCAITASASDLRVRSAQRSCGRSSSGAKPGFRSRARRRTRLCSAAPPPRHSARRLSSQALVEYQTWLAECRTPADEPASDADYCSAYADVRRGAARQTALPSLQQMERCYSVRRALQLRARVLGLSAEAVQVSGCAVCRRLGLGRVEAEAQIGGASRG